MRSQSNKYRKRNKDHAQKRKSWGEEKNLCQVCNYRSVTEVHHIAGRNAKARDEVAKRYECEKNWLAVCRRCHSMIDKECPAYWACAAKMLAGELDLAHLQILSPGRKFSIDDYEIKEVVEYVLQWRMIKKQPL